MKKLQALTPAIIKAALDAAARADVAGRVVGDPHVMSRHAALIRKGGRKPGKEPRPAAVLVPLVQRAEGLGVLLTQRTDHLANHAGQISFPGGRIEPDDKTPLAAALRETQEETGLSPQSISILGTLPDYLTGTDFKVTPIVGLLQPPLTLKPDPFEVAEIFEVPLDHFLDPANHQRCERVSAGVKRAFMAMPYGERYVWGATAGMLFEFYQTLNQYHQSLASMTENVS